MKALIFAAGLGTRLKPLTDTMPKALVPVHGQTLLEYQIRKLQSAGINDIIVNVHHFPDMIIDYLRENNNFGSNISISDERDNLLDTGGGLLKAWSTFAPDESLLAINVDILSDINLRDIIDEYPRNQSPVTRNPFLGLLVVKSRETQRYFCFDGENKLVGWTNIATGELKPSGFQMKESEYRRLAFSGMQVLGPQVLPLLQAYNNSLSPVTCNPLPVTHNPSSFNKFSIIDFYLHIVEHDLGTLRALQIDLPLLDVGKLDQLSQLS